MLLDDANFFINIKCAARNNIHRGPLNEKSNAAADH